MECVESHASFGGVQRVWVHASAATGCDMRFAVYTPPGPGPFPVLLFLSGLTCSEQNAITKAGLQREAARRGLIVVVPDTSPRGKGIPDVPDSDLGGGAGFWLDATEEPWARHYRMASYVLDDLPKAVAEVAPVAAGPWGVMGHSMGGLGALVLAMRNPERFRSLSAISPICAPTRVPWGRKAFEAYLGPEGDAWAAHDPCELLGSHGWSGEVLVDQGAGDDFLATQLLPDALEAAAAATGTALTLRRHAGYDHGYYFVATVIADHVDFHADRVG